MKLDWKPVSVSDACWIHQMRYDEEIRLNLTTHDRYSLEQCEDWIIHLPKDSRRLAIYDYSKSYDPIGLFRIDRISYKNQNCLFGLDINKKYRGKGLAKPIWNLMLNEWFLNENMNRIYLEVLEFNHKAVGIYKQLGFVEDGVWKDAVYRNNLWTNLIIMSLAKKDYIQ